jgi:hypothetical protein
MIVRRAASFDESENGLELSIRPVSLSYPHVHSEFRRGTAECSNSAAKKEKNPYCRFRNPWTQLEGPNAAFLSCGTHLTCVEIHKHTQACEVSEF